MTMQRPWFATIVLLAAATLTSACTTETTPPDTARPDRSTPTAVATSPASESTRVDEEGSTTVDVWFHYGDKLFVTQREVPETRAVGAAAVEALLARPSEFEANAGLGTAIDPETELLDLVVVDGIATIDLSSDFDSGGGSLEEQMRVAQVVYTLTQFPTVQGVEFMIEGEAVTSFGSHGLVMDDPQRRKDYQDLYPQILVRSPVMGERVSSPVTVTGDANVFEATVSFRILDENGDEIATEFATATCGSGCRGDYSGEVAFKVDHEQHGVIEVFESSAEDGSDLHKVQIAVTLVP